MNRALVILLLLSSFASAQEGWVGQDTVWNNSGDQISQILDPCFTKDQNTILLSVNNRIMSLDYSHSDTLAPFLPDSLALESYEITPYLSYDGQSLYFSSNLPGGYGGADIWVSRLVDSTWQMPVNLGPNINSQHDEMGPTLSADGTELFFCSAVGGDIIPINYFGNIMKSTLVDRQWTPAVALPAPINSAFGEREPAISADGNLLYFISQRPLDTLDCSAWVTRRNGDSWTNPILLRGFVNATWEECPFMREGDPFSVAIDSLGIRLLYSKLQIYECIDPETHIYISHPSTSIDDGRDLIPQAIVVNLYPNPFNSSLAITFTGLAPADIAIYDLLGNRIRVFSNVVDNSVIWNGKNDDGISCASGIYFVKASSGEHSIVRSATLLK